MSMENIEMTQEAVGPIVAAEEPQSPNAAALAELDRRIRELEAAIGDFRTVKAQGTSAGRKTAPASLMARGEGADAASVDDALRSLSLEQRIAVKSGLLRAGLLR
jgi:hypothetical protein